MSAAIPTLIAVLAGIALGLTGGGSFDNLLRWRPVAWQLALGAIVIQLLFRLLPLDGTFAVVLDVISMLLLIAFAVLNIKVAGMVVILIGLVLNLIPTVINNGTPVSPDALVSAGLVERADLDRVELEGPRHVQTDDDSLTFLGEVIAIPTGQVVSFGDLILLLGEMLTISALLRNRRIGPAARRPATGRGAGAPPKTRRPAPSQQKARKAAQQPAKKQPPPQRPPQQRPPQSTQPKPKPKPEPEVPPRANTRRGSSNAPRIPYEDLVAGLAEPDRSKGRTARRPTRPRETHTVDPEVDLRDESLKRRP